LKKAMAKIVGFSLSAALGGTYLGVLYLLDGRMLLGKLTILVPWGLSVITGIVYSVLEFRGEVYSDSVQNSTAKAKNQKDKKQFGTKHTCGESKSWEAKLEEMDGYEFEEFVAKLFEKMGYETTVTKASNDQGVDVIAKTPFEILAIQAKNHANKISNSAVQEIVAAKNSVQADKAIVVASSDFTHSAKKLASVNNVRLVNKTELLDMIDENM